MARRRRGGLEGNPLLQPSDESAPIESAAATPAALQAPAPPARGAASPAGSPRLTARTASPSRPGPNAETTAVGAAQRLSAAEASRGLKDDKMAAGAAAPHTPAARPAPAASRLTAYHWLAIATGALRPRSF